MNKAVALYTEAERTLNEEALACKKLVNDLLEIRSKANDINKRLADIINKRNDLNEEDYEQFDDMPNDIINAIEALRDVAFALEDVGDCVPEEYEDALETIACDASFDGDTLESLQLSS